MWTRHLDGAIDARVQRIAQALNLHLVLWNRDTNDWRYKSESFLQNPPVVRAFQGWLMESDARGSISLQHEIDSVPVRQIGPSLDLLLNSTYQVLDIPGCTNLFPYDDDVLIRAGFLPKPVLPSVVGVATSTPAPSSGLSNIVKTGRRRKKRRMARPVSPVLPSQL